MSQSLTSQENEENKSRSMAEQNKQMKKNNVPEKRRVFGEVTNRHSSTNANLARKSSKSSNDKKILKAEVKKDDVCSKRMEEDKSRTLIDLETSDFDHSMNYSTPKEQISSLDTNLVRQIKFTTAHDEANRNNEYENPDFAPAILQYMRATERNYLIADDYMRTVQQGQITWNMRRTLVDWLVELMETLGLNHETLYSSVKLLDMYLRKEVTHRSELQLVGACAIFVASKYEEHFPPLSEDLVFLSDHAFSKEDLMKKERLMLRIVDFDINIPSSYRFLRRFGKTTGVDMKRLTLARYALELSLFDERFLNIPHSLAAAASLWIAFKLERPILNWDEKAVSYSGYEEKELITTVDKLNELLVAAPESTTITVREKYMSSLFFSVAKVEPFSEDDLQEERLRIMQL